MAMYVQTQQGTVGARINWNVNGLRKLAAKVRTFWAPADYLEVHAQMNRQPNVDLWLDALRAGDSLTSYRY